MLFRSSELVATVQEARVAVTPESVQLPTGFDPSTKTQALPPGTPVVVSTVTVKVVVAPTVLGFADEAIEVVVVARPTVMLIAEASEAR